jgi:hypothetical protein
MKLKHQSVVFLFAFLAMLGAAPLAYATDGATPTAITIAASGPAAVGSTLESHVNNDGSVLLRGAKITALNGATLTVTQTWGAYVATWTVVTDPSTELLRRYDGASSVTEFSVGDYVAVKGVLDASASSPTVKAIIVRDYSIQKKNASFSGTVSSVASSSFVLATASRGNVTVVVDANTAIKEGGASTTFAAIAAGKKITLASGLFNNLTSTLQATKVDIYQNKALLSKRTFEGTLKSLTASATPPTTLVLTVGSTDFTVNVPLNISIIGQNWLTLPLSSFVVGDKVRVYGAVQPQSMTTIDASIVRDASR